MAILNSPNAEWWTYRWVVSAVITSRTAANGQPRRACTAAMTTMAASSASPRTTEPLKRGSSTGP
jgi:hypothetical protein